MVGFPLGRYGDNHVHPDALFDVDDGQAVPPPDAMDLQFRHPCSLNTLLDAMARAGHRDVMGQWQRILGELAADTERWVQRSCGRVVDADRAGSAPARLSMSTVIHGSVPGFTVARWHLHVYVGATATSLIDGRLLPVDWPSVTIGLRGPAQRRHISEVWRLTREQWGVRWDCPRPGAEDEIVDPPWHEHIDSLERGVCPGPGAGWARPVMVADATVVEMAARDEYRAAHDGPGYRRAPLMFEDDPEPTAAVS